MVRPLIFVVSTAVLSFGISPCTAQSIEPTGQDVVPRLQTLEPFISEASARFGIPGRWIRAVIAAESDGRITVNGQPITSRSSAIGPMQVMPKTYEELRLRYGLGPDPGDLRQNILAGAAYLKELHERFGETGMLAAYNAGPERYQAHLTGDLPLPEETQGYLVAVEKIAAGGVLSREIASGQSLFIPFAGGESPRAVPPKDLDQRRVICSNEPQKRTCFGDDDGVVKVPDS